nr:LppP/LprE family lipoprotein [Streptomyces cinnamoneus]
MAAAAGLLLAGCGTSSDGVRKEGPAQTQSAAKAASRAPSAAASPAQKIDAVKLIKSDPKVSDQVKKNLKPCVKDEYPVDVIYGELTGEDRPDVVVNVLTCADSFGIGSYVYRAKGDAYENVFVAEQSPVYADIDRRDLTITKQVYGPGDAVCCPSGQDVLTYHWSDSAFQETGRTHTDYSKVGNTGKVPSEGTEG